MLARAVESSPEYSAKSGSSSATSSRTRSRSGLASFSPTMFGTSASRATVAGSRSTAVRPGTL